MHLKRTARGRQCAWSAASGCWCWRRTPATAGRACADSSRARRASCPPHTSPPRSTRTRTNTSTPPHTSPPALLHGMHVHTYATSAYAT
uniref:Uncharacterized protein n=1 Tax=Papilio polytes TaxID=76194 RepID=I4DQZ6_PAPPL|nr:unknown secreted protein [Papilio polytes]